MQLTFEISPSYRKSGIIVVGNVRAIFLSEPDRNELLQYFTEAERSALVARTMEWLRSNNGPLNFHSRNRLKAFLIQMTSNVVDPGKSQIVLNDVRLFSNYANYHYLIHLHQSEGIPFVNLRACYAFYLRALSSIRWRKLKKAKLFEQGGVCAAAGCFTDADELHHLHYHNLGREQLCDVAAYCTLCHRHLHLYLPISATIGQFEQLEIKMFSDRLNAG